MVIAPNAHVPSTSRVHNLTRAHALPPYLALHEAPRLPLYFHVGRSVAGEEMKESVQSADSSHPLLAACRSVSLPAGRYVPTFSSPGNDAEGSPSRGFSMPLFSMGSFKPRHSEESGVSASTEAAESPNAHSAPITIQHSSAAKRNLSGALDDAAMASSTVGNTTPESSLASAATPPPRRSRDGAHSSCAETKCANALQCGHCLFLGCALAVLCQMLCFD